MRGFYKRENRIIRLGLISFVILMIIILLNQFYPEHKTTQQKDAIDYMEEMILAISSHCIDNDIEIDSLIDPAKTGLIGPELTEITTTLGHLEAKRTTIQPEFAALMIRFLDEVGVKKGDTIALVSSGSFPGLLLATLSASKAAGLECKTIISIGSSSFGANRLELNILDIYNILHQKGLIKNDPVGVSLGGENDIGTGWEIHTIQELKKEIDQSGYNFIYSNNLQESVLEREKSLGISEQASVKALINAGGAMANIGTSPSILKIKPGLIRKHVIPDLSQQGIVHRALEYNIPVIHLLNIKGLAMEYGLKWDPANR